MGINQVLYNLTALIAIVLAFLLFYISISKIDNTVVNKKGGTLELSEVLINYKLPSISVMLIPTLYLFGIIFLLFQVYNGRFAIQEYYNTNINNMILVSVTLVISFVAINYSVNDTDYFVITMKDVIIHKNISKFILYMFLNCFIIFIIVLFHELIPNYVSNIKLLITSLYIISLLSLIIFEITVVAKVYNIYYSTKKFRLKLLTNLYFYRFDDLSKNEYSFKYKNYIDGVYYLTDKLYKNLTKYNITDIDIIQPNIGIADFFISSHKILSNRLIKSVFTRIYLCNSFVPFSFIIISLLISTTIDFTIVKCTGIAIFILSFIINYIKMRKMIRNKHDGIIYSENELERYIKRHMGLDAIIVYGDKYSTIRFEDTIFRDELSKNIVNLIIYLRVLFIAFKQNYSTDEYINKIKEIDNIIINRYDNRIIFYILLYLALSVSDCKKISEIAQIRKDNHNFAVFELYKRAICFFKLNCFYGDIEKYYKLSKII